MSNEWRMMTILVNTKHRRVIPEVTIVYVCNDNTVSLANGHAARPIRKICMNKERTEVLVSLRESIEDHVNNIEIKLLDNPDKIGPEGEGELTYYNVCLDILDDEIADRILLEKR